MCGSISRYLIQNIASVQTDRFYLTLAINIAGSLAIGIAWVLLTHFNAGRWANGLFVGASSVASPLSRHSPSTQCCCSKTAARPKRCFTAASL